MAHLSDLLSVGGNISITLSIAAVAVVAYVLYSVYSSIAKNRAWPGIPLVSVDGLTPHASFFQKGTKTLNQGMKDYPGGVFQIMTGTGPKIILPNQYTDELRNHSRLSFNEAFKPDFFHTIPGFDGFKAGFTVDNIIQDTVRIKLTQSLGLVTDDLVEETRVCIDKLFGEKKDWHTTGVKPPVLDMVAQLSSRVFLGPELCRNQRWLEIAKGYTIDSFAAARELRKVPVFLRGIWHWFIPACQNLREEVRDAHVLIDAEVARRADAAEKILAAGKKPPKTADTIGWMVEMAKGRKVDYVGCQLSLSMAAIHTTTEAITQFLMNLIENPEYMQPLRDEIISVLREQGISRTSLYQLRLMDSFLKESQRYYRPVGLIQRGVTGKNDLVLSDGTRIPASSRIGILSEHMNPKNYPEPFKFDGRRFLRKRDQPGQNNNHQFVTTSPEHFGFGHGEHACPGRFFATNEIKIALCNLLLKYDWRPVPDKEQPTSFELEGAVMTNPMFEIQFKSRTSEVEL